MARWEVVSPDEAGEAPSVSLREIIHAHTHLPSRTRRVITAEEEEEEEGDEEERVKVRRSCLFRKCRVLKSKSLNQVLASKTFRRLKHVHETVEGSRWTHNKHDYRSIYNMYKRRN